MDTHDYLSKSYVSETVIIVKHFLTIFCIPVEHQNVLKAAKYLRTFSLAVKEKKFFKTGTKYQDRNELARLVSCISEVYCDPNFHNGPACD